jgi:DNA-binding IclR family transcriptional regulator
VTEHTVDLDKHRGMAAQKATELRRLVSEVAADRAKLKARQDELEKFLVAAPAAGWPEAAEKVRYLLSLFAATSEAQDPRRKTLIASLLADLERLLGEAGEPSVGPDE